MSDACNCRRLEKCDIEFQLHYLNEASIKAYKIVKMVTDTSYISGEAP